MSIATRESWHSLRPKWCTFAMTYICIASPWHTNATGKPCTFAVRHALSSFLSLLSHFPHFLQHQIGLYFQSLPTSYPIHHTSAYGHHVAKLFYGIAWSISSAQFRLYARLRFQQPSTCTLSKINYRLSTGHIPRKPVSRLCLFGVCLGESIVPRKQQHSTRIPKTWNNECPRWDTFSRHTANSARLS